MLAFMLLFIYKVFYAKKCTGTRYVLLNDAFELII